MATLKKVRDGKRYSSKLIASSEPSHSATMQPHKDFTIIVQDYSEDDISVSYWLTLDPIEAVKFAQYVLEKTRTT